MNYRLKTRDIVALGFMTFALFVGAGNIIFPPIVGLEAGPHVWIAALGFLITAVGLPVITVVALARVGGGIDALSTPIGRKAGIVLATVCYLAVGPLFATPRTATVSFEAGIAPLVGSGGTPLLIYSLVYFAIVIGISLYPGRLLDTVGHILAPVKIIALGILGVAALLWPAGSSIPPAEAYRSIPFSSGFLNGYITMDTLGAMVFGIVIVNAARSRGVSDAKLLTRYTIMAGLIAGIGLALVYLSLFHLGAHSGQLIPEAQNGAEILHVGAGTFQPVRVDSIEDHVMHAEYAEVPQDVVDAVLACKARGNRVIAVGTTSVRSLESAAQASSDAIIAPFFGDTRIFIYPGYHYRVIDALVTNFHLPESTLIMTSSSRWACCRCFRSRSI